MRIWGGLGGRRFVRRRRHPQHVAGLCEAVLAGGAGEQAVVPDAVEPTRQSVQQEAADELVGGQGHDLPPVGSWVEGAKRERLNQAILNQAVTTDALPLSHRAHPPAQRVSSSAPFWSSIERL